MKINITIFLFYFNLIIFNLILNINFNYYFAIIINIRIYNAKSNLFKINNIVKNSENLDMIDLKIFEILKKLSFNCSFERVIKLILDIFTFKINIDLNIFFFLYFF